MKVSLRLVPQLTLCIQGCTRHPRLHPNWLHPPRLLNSPPAAAGLFSGGSSVLSLLSAAAAAPSSGRVVMATGGGSTGAEFEAHALGHPKHGAEAHEGQLGACPFSMRVLLVLEEKEVPYTVNYVDVIHKPEWVGKVNPKGQLPIVKDLSSGQFLYDSDVISDFLEDKYGTGSGTEKKPLKKVQDCPQPGPQLWPKFTAYLQAKGGSQEEESAKKELLEQLKMIEEAVPNDSPYVGGHDVCAYDAAMAPRLYLARQGCKLLKGWDFGEELPNVKAYLHRMTGRASWRNAASWDDDCIAADLRRKMPAA